MKLTNLTKGLMAASFLAVASFSANASVIASSYLEVNNFSLNGVSGSDLTFLADGTREGNTSSQINYGTNMTDGDSDASTALGDVDALLACSGQCAPLGLVENSGGLYWNDALTNGYNYSYADQVVSGNALDGSSSGFTLAEASLDGVPSGNASSNGNIYNEFEALFRFNGASDANVNFSLDYVLAMASKITPTVAFDDLIKATTTAFANFTVTLSQFNISGNLAELQQWEIVDSTISGRDGAFLNNFFPGTNERVKNETVVGYNSGDFLLEAGTSYSLNISQTTSTNVSLVPEPTSIAIFGLGLLGLAGAARRRQS
jgi:hypothetical protein